MIPPSSRSSRVLTSACALATLLFVSPVAVSHAGNRTAQRFGAGEDPRALKEQALSRLFVIEEGLAAGEFQVGDRTHAREEIADAIEELEESLAPEFWARNKAGEIDGLRLDPERGHHVFHEERHCAQEIFDAIRLGKIGDLDLRDELSSIVDLLVTADRRLADVAIGDAAGAGGDPEELAEAEAELERGDALVEAAADTPDLARRMAKLYEAMDGAYRHAWTAAVDAREDLHARVGPSPRAAGRIGAVASDLRKRQTSSAACPWCQARAARVR